MKPNMPSNSVPIHVLEIFFSEGPPNVDDEKDGQQEPAEQDTAIAGPEVFERGADVRHR
jgi:hypothetical protein